MRINNLLLNDLLIENNNVKAITMKDCDEIYNAIAMNESKMTEEQQHMLCCLRHSSITSLNESHFLYNYFGEKFYLQFGITEGLWDRLLDVDIQDDYFEDIGPDGVSYSQVFNALIDLCEIEAVMKNDRVVYDMTYTTSAKFLMFELIRRHNIMVSNNLMNPDDVISDPDEI